MTVQAPKLDIRKAGDIVEQAGQLVPVYVDDWQGFDDPTEPGRVMIDQFARLMELLIERLNRVPEKNFLEFLALIGVEQKPGTPGSVPVTFLLSKTASEGGDIPERTQVATTQTEKGDAQIFETRKAFYATPAQLKRIVNLIPGQEQYSEWTMIDLPPKPEQLVDDSRVLTVLSPPVDDLQAIDHILYLGSEALFGKKEKVTITLTFTLATGQKIIIYKDKLQWKKYSKKEKTWKNIAATYTSPADSEVTLADFEGTDQGDLNGKSKKDYWIACYFTGTFGAGLRVPEITQIQGQLSQPAGTTSEAKIDAAFFNNDPLDLSKPFYPFGVRPKYGDAFYLSSAAAFSPDIASATLTFSLFSYTTDMLKAIFKKDATLTAVVEWQYLSAQGEWTKLATFKDVIIVTSATGTISRTIYREIADEIADVTSVTPYEDGCFYGTASNSSESSFTLNIPDGIGINQIKQVPGYWLRALIRSTDPYGKDAYYDTSSGTLAGPTFIPPIIENATIEFTYKSHSVPIDSMVTMNNFEYREHSEGTRYPFTPFVPITSLNSGGNENFIAPEPSLYLGFDKPFGDVFISMYAHLKEAFSAERFTQEGGKPRITWEYAAPDSTWKPLDVQDETVNLTSSGTVAFVGPEKTTALKLFTLDGEVLHWYRVRLLSGYYEYPPALRGMFLNTVMADNQSTSPNDLVVGSGTGEKSQTLKIIKTPVISGEVWVRELNKPNDEELQDHLKDANAIYGLNGEDALALEDVIQKKTGKDGGNEIWVRWLPIPNFLSSTPRSRHYTLERIQGVLTFGDNATGLTPPAGKDNIIIENFRIGGGERANDAAVPLSIKELKSSIPYVSKVFNVQNAAGGSDFWSLDQTMQFGPQLVKTRNRSVTTEDYEWMVLQEFSSVARTRCLATRAPAQNNTLVFKPGAVTMVIVPKGSGRMLQPPRGLISRVRDFLAAKVVGTIVEDISVIGPQYEEITVKATVKGEKPEESSMVERRVAQALERFFHPLIGGDRENGWEFGRAVYLSELYAVIERIPGVDYVASLSFADKPGVNSFPVNENSIVASGIHQIEMT